MAHCSVKNTILIKDLCNHLGLSFDSKQLESEKGLESLLPQIQERLNQLRDEDTYGNVEEIPTDSCPVVYAREPEKPAANLVDDALCSIMQSMVSTQVRLMLVAQTLISGEASVGATSCSRGTSWRVLSDPFCSLLAEIRSELLLNEIFLSVMGIALDIVIGSRGSNSSSCCSNCSKINCVSEQHKPSQLSNTSLTTRSHDSGNNKGSHTSARSTISIHGAQTSSGATTNSHSSSSFRGFPCYPNTRSGTTSSGGGGHGQARIWDPLVDGARPRMESRLVMGSDAHQPSRGGDAQQDWNEPPASWIEYASDSSSADDAQTGQGSVWRHRTDGELISYSNVVARHHKGKRAHRRKLQARRHGDKAVAVRSNKSQGGLHNDLVIARRRDYYWPIEDNYLQPYEDIAVVARDHWQFVLDKLDHCPTYARFNRLRRADMLTQRQKYPELNQLMAGNQQASRPLEMYNGIVHPLGPTAAPCRAVFLDS